jgi:hypothetical protein
MANKADVDAIRTKLEEWKTCEAAVEAIRKMVASLKKVEGGKLQFHQVGMSCGIDIPWQLQAKIRHDAISEAEDEIVRINNIMYEMEFPAAKPEWS